VISAFDSDKVMRILALVTDAFGGRGGIAQYNRDLLSALSRCEHVSEVIVLPRVRQELPGELPSKIAQLPPIAGRVRFSLAAARLAAFSGPFDVVFCGHLFMTPTAVALARLMRLPLWLQVHGVDAWRRPGDLLKSGLEGATLVTAVSRYTRHRILQWADIRPERVKVLPNTFRVRPKSVRRSSTDGVSFSFHGKPYIITVSRVTREDAYKGHRRVLDVLPVLRQRFPELQYVVVGGGDDLPALREYAEALGISHAVHFLGHLGNVELSILLENATLFVMPSTKEGFGIVFLEAAAFGLPVIGGNLDGSVDALGEGAIGTPVNPHNREELLAAISAGIQGELPMPDPRALARFAPHNFEQHVAELFATFRQTRAPFSRGSEEDLARSR
jgi:phosphatidylinositol alpha-1,6-mannosyltransferase